MAIQASETQDWVTSLESRTLFTDDLRRSVAAKTWTADNEKSHLLAALSRLLVLGSGCLRKRDYIRLTNRVEGLRETLSRTSRRFPPRNGQELASYSKQIRPPVDLPTVNLELLR